MDNEVKFKIDILAKLDNLEKIIAGFSRASQKATGFNQTVDRTAKTLKGKFSESTRSLNQLNDVYIRLKTSYMNATDPERMHAYAGMIERVRKRMDELTHSTQTCEDSAEKIKGGFFDKLGISKGALFGGGIGLLAASALRSGYGIGKEASEAAAQVEQYNVTLKTMLGSTTAARDRMQEYFNLAKKTPFALAEVVEGGNKLQAIGRYSAENLTMLGDLAAASGKPLEQVMSAYSKLATGQKGEGVNMFRDLLISVEDFTKATGKGVSKNGELLATTEDMIRSLPGIMKAKGYFGMMANQADTTKGKISNLEDGIFQLKVALGERLNPSINIFSEYTSRAVDKMTRWVEIPLEEKIAREKAEVNLLVDSLIENIDQEEKRAGIIDELNRKYPEILKNIDTEKMNTEQLRKELEKVNDAYDKKMRNATYENLKRDLQEDMDVAQEDVDRIVASQSARSKLKEVGSAINAYMQGEGISGLGFGKKGPFGGYGYVYNNGSEANLYNYKSEQQAELKRMAAEYNVYNDMVTAFDSNRKLAKKQEKVQQFLAQIQAVEKLIHPDEVAKIPGGDDSETSETPDNPETPGGSELEKAAATISAGGKSVKNFNITIHDGLIKQVDNHFGSTDETPESAGDFMWQLSQALQTMLNDVNYAAA
jgi:hypothetical protein